MHQKIPHVLIVTTPLVSAFDASRLPVFQIFSVFSKYPETSKTKSESRRGQVSSAQSRLPGFYWETTAVLSATTTGFFSG
jgi:hypothetical protein